MIRELTLREIQKHGGSAALANRLLIYGDKPYLTWLVNTLDTRGGGIQIVNSLKEIAQELNISDARVRYAFYYKNPTPLSELRLRVEFNNVIETLTCEFPYPALWRELAPYAYAHMRNLAIEVLVDRNYTAAAICEYLNVKKTLVYATRKAYLARYVQMKGDRNDT